MKLEICAGSWQSAQAAALGGAHRIELCSALSEGGLTPSAGLLRQCLSLHDRLKVHVLIRPRQGDFVYTPQEIAIMADDIRTAVQCGADGVVIGALTPQGEVDLKACQCLIEAANGVENITFHRAFDLCRDPFQSMEQIMDLGCNRILTSGQSRTAFEGIPMLRQLVERSAGRIIIMPGCGVGVDNASRILKETGATEIHASARSAFASSMQYRKDSVHMGAAGADEYSWLETDAHIVHQIVSQL